MAKRKQQAVHMKGETVLALTMAATRLGYSVVVDEQSPAVRIGPLVTTQSLEQLQFRGDYSCTLVPVPETIGGTTCALAHALEFEEAYEIGMDLCDELLYAPE